MEYFGIGSNQSWTVLRVSFDLGIDVFGFFFVSFGITVVQ